ncbi:hypothetical protein BC830DRAFT_590888 [Chytriomyces sp. MP71]|nr:hypothetical protein BC830DRAFT_590888 [Chytriomyces sp. MP71]
MGAGEGVSLVWQDRCQTGARNGPRSARFCAYGPVLQGQKHSIDCGEGREGVERGPRGGRVRLCSWTLLCACQREQIAGNLGQGREPAYRLCAFIVVGAAVRVVWQVVAAIGHRSSGVHCFVGFDRAPHICDDGEIFVAVLGSPNLHSQALDPGATSAQSPRVMSTLSTACEHDLGDSARRRTASDHGNFINTSNLYPYFELVVRTTYIC